MMNSLHANINNCNANYLDITNRIKEIQSNKVDVVTTTPAASDVLKADIDAIRTKLVMLENTMAKERTLIEQTVIAKMEEFVKRVVRERITIESDVITDKIRAHVDEHLVDRDMDTMSIAQSETPGKSSRKRTMKKNVAIDVE